jgi:hypothetical protein
MRQQSAQILRARDYGRPQLAEALTLQVSILQAAMGRVLPTDGVREQRWVCDSHETASGHLRAAQANSQTSDHH